MRIAMIGHKSIPSHRGGVEIHVEELAKRLVAKGHEVTAFNRSFYQNNHEKHLHGIRLRRVGGLNSKRLETITATFFATVLAMFGQYDIIHYHALGPSFFAGLARLSGKKVVCTVHGLDWQRGKWGKFASWFLKTGEQTMMKRANCAISVSEDLLVYFKDTYGREIDYVPNGVNKPVMRSPSIITEKFGLKGQDYFLFLARLVPEKGLDYLIDAYKKLATNKKLVIAGDASHTNDYVKRIHKLAENCPNILFTGFVENDLLSELYSNAYVYILPSDVEGMPISLMEAMSYGCTAIVSDIPQNTRVIGEFGYAFRHSDAQDLARVMIDVENHPEMRFSPELLQETTINRYSWDIAADKTESIYESILRR